MDQGVDCRVFIARWDGYQERKTTEEVVDVVAIVVVVDWQEGEGGEGRNEEGGGRKEKKGIKTAGWESCCWLRG